MTYLPVLMYLYDMMPYLNYYNNHIMDHSQYPNAQTNITIQRNNYKEVVPIDTLKPAYIDTFVKTDPTSPTSNLSPIDISSTSTLPPHNLTLLLRNTTVTNCLI